MSRCACMTDNIASPICKLCPTPERWAAVCVRLDGLEDKIVVAVHDELCGCDNGPAGREARVSARLLTLLQSLAVQ